MYTRIVCNTLVVSATFAAGNVNAQVSKSRRGQHVELEPIVVTATRQETNLSDVAGTINVISRKKMSTGVTLVGPAWKFLFSEVKCTSFQE